MAVLNITKQNFEEEVIAEEKPVLVDFWAPWCGPCRMLSPVIDELANEHDAVKVAKVNIDEQQELAREYQIMTVPSLLLFKDGKPVAKSIGVKPKEEIEKMLK